MGPRLLLVHQQWLREEPRKLYNSLAAFLGAAPFAEEAVFHKYNSQRGPRTGICQNQSHVRTLRRRLSPEYRTLEQSFRFAGLSVPLDLAYRRTRCDRPAEISRQ